MFENNKTRDIGLEIQSKHLSNDLSFPLLFCFFFNRLQVFTALAEFRKELYLCEGQQVLEGEQENQGQKNKTQSSVLLLLPL